MTIYVVIRPYTTLDEVKSQELIKEYVMAFANKIFWWCLFKEITIECIVVVWALLFIFFGVPLLLCALSIPPGCIIFVIVCVYSSCYFKAAESSKINPNESWIAEAYEPLLSVSKPLEYNEEICIGSFPYNQNKYETKAKIVGIIGLKAHNARYNSAWINKFAVHPRYPFSKIAIPLIQEILKYCFDQGYSSIELTTSEWQENERDIFTALEFNVRQIYHKPIIGSTLTMMKCQLGISFNRN